MQPKCIHFSTVFSASLRSEARTHCVCVPCIPSAIIQQAYGASLCVLGHDATNITAWVRLGDACWEVRRWQLAQLCYKAALKLQDDPLVQVSVSYAQHALLAPYKASACVNWLEITCFLGGLEGFWQVSAKWTSRPG